MRPRRLLSDLPLFACVLVAAATALASPPPRLGVGVHLLMGAGHAKDIEQHPNGRRKHCKGVEYGGDGSTVVGSLFGRIGDGVEAPSGEGPRELLYQDALVACFVPMKAVHHQHVLVVPRCAYPPRPRSASPAAGGQGPQSAARHIATCADLVEADRPLLQHMRSVGQLVLNGRAAAAAANAAADPSTTDRPATLGVCAASFCFHRPPYNSIDHLHLHCIGLSPPRQLTGYLKYPPGLDVPWCVKLDSLLAQRLKGQ